MHVYCRGIVTRWPVVKANTYDNHENGVIFAQNNPEVLEFVATRKMAQIVAQLLSLRLYAGSEDAREDWTDRYAVEIPVSTSSMGTREPERFALVVPNFNAPGPTRTALLRMHISEIDSSDMPNLTRAICDAAVKAREPHEARVNVYRVLEGLFASTPS